MTSKKDMNSRREDFGTTYATDRKEVYVFGGYAKDAIDHCEKYSVMENKWTELEPMTKKKYHVSACLVDNQFIFVIGGQYCEFLNDIDKYVIDDNSWETI